ncbi:CotD family spore coat protein [Celeribacter halophilus]
MHPHPTETNLWKKCEQSTFPPSYPQGSDSNHREQIKNAHKFPESP